MKLKLKATEWMMIIFIIVVTIIILLISRNVGALPILEPGNCSVYNLTKIVNLSDYPENVTALEVGMSHMVCCEACTNYSGNCTNQNIIFDLLPGENKSGWKQNCFYNLTCGKGSCPSICSINEVIFPDEEFIQSSAGCDVRVSCEECPECEYEEYKVSKYYVLSREDNKSNILLKDDKDEVILTLTPTQAFTQSFTIPFVCPAFNITRDLEEDDELSYKVCKKYEPYMYETLLLQRNLVADYSEALAACNGKITLVNEKVSTLEHTAGRCEGSSVGRLEAAETELNVSVRELETCRTDLGVAKGRSDLFDMFFYFSFFGFLTMGGLTLFYYRKANRLHKGVK